MARCYVRNGVWGWTIPEQERVLAADGVLDPQALYKDELSAHQTKMPGRVRAEWLVWRTKMLQPTSRRAETIHVATFLALAPKITDLASALAQASARGATIVAHDSGVSVPPDGGAAAVNAALDDWLRAKRVAQTKPGRMIGVQAAAAVKLARTERLLPIARPLWRKPDEYTPAQVAEASGLSIKTLYDRLGRRPAKRKGRSRVKA